METSKSSLESNYCHSQPLFVFIFVFSKVNSKHVQYKISPMTGFEPRTSAIGSNHSANLATTTAQNYRFFLTNLTSTKVWPSSCVTRFGEISPLWHNFKSLRQIFESLFIIWQNVYFTLAKMLCYWASFHCCR